MRSLIFSVEIILYILLLLIYVSGLFPYYDFGKITQELENIIYFKSLTYSLLNYELFKDIRNYNYDIFVILSQILLRNRFNSFGIKISKYIIVDIYPNGSCSLLFYPLPIPHDNIRLEVLSKYLARCNDVSYIDDWKLAIVYVNSSLRNSISLKLNESIDPYSLFAFDFKGNPLRIYNVSLDGSYLNLTLDTLYNNEIILLFRLSNYSNLTYLQGRYSIVNYINGTIADFIIMKGPWITVAIDNKCILDNKLIFKESYPASYLPKLNINPKYCTSPINVTYSERIKLNVFSDISYILPIVTQAYRESENIIFPARSPIELKIYAS